MKNMFEQQKFLVDSLLTPRDPDRFNPTKNDWGEAEEAFDGLEGNKDGDQ
jgi:hypothetical protein